MRAEFTGLVDALQKIPAIRNYFQAASDHVAEQGKAAISNARLQNIGKSNLFGNMLAENEKDSKSLTDMDILTEAQGFLVAGSGTTAVTLTYLVWAVLQQPTLRKQLEDEVGALKPDYDDATLETLPLLNAVINETLRLYGAAPGSLPRTVPEGGCTLGGYHIPGGITVCTQAYSMHRDESIFPNASSYVVPQKPADMLICTDSTPSDSFRPSRPTRKLHLPHSVQAPEPAWEFIWLGWNLDMQQQRSFVNVQVRDWEIRLPMRVWR